MSFQQEKSLRSYVIGYVVSLILTFVAFYLVETKTTLVVNLYVSLMMLAIVQLFVQSLCFLGISGRPSGRWNLWPYLFVILVVCILVGGTMWIMYNLNYNMLME